MTGGDEAPTCMACGRPLRDEESRRLRLGPVCRRRLTDLLAPRPRIVGTHTAGPHPQAIPARVTAQLAFDIWDDQDDDEQPASRRITDVPTGALL
ncbi:DUF6011 domain-containing protein [Streptomyces sp. NPDC013172]|uniref:DUF6011 domain-containing protein n=1 Tax=Streptomyces atriruber TaxID=545121 RepID=A0ABV3C114_9ACTN